MLGLLYLTNKESRMNYTMQVDLFIYLFGVEHHAAGRVLVL